MGAGVAGVLGRRTPGTSELARPAGEGSVVGAPAGGARARSHPGPAPPPEAPPHRPRPRPAPALGNDLSGGEAPAAQPAAPRTRGARTMSAERPPGTRARRRRGRWVPGSLATPTARGTPDGGPH